MLEGLLILFGNHPASLDEVPPGNLVDGLVFLGLFHGLPVRIVRQFGIAADSEEILYSPLGGKSVVIPTHGIGDVLSDHPLVTNDEILMGVAEDMTDVKRARHRRGRSIDDKSLIAGQGRVPPVGSPLLPLLPPLVLDLVVFVLLGNLGHAFLRQRIFGLARCNAAHDSRGSTG